MDDIHTFLTCIIHTHTPVNIIVHLYNMCSILYVLVYFIRLVYNVFIRVRAEICKYYIYISHNMQQSTSRTKLNVKKTGYNVQKIKTYRTKQY